MEEVVTSEEELQRRSEAFIVKEQEERVDSLDARGRRSLSERMRAKFYSTVYGQSMDDDAKSSATQQDGAQAKPAEKRALDQLIDEERKQKPSEASPAK